MAKSLKRFKQVLLIIVLYLALATFLFTTSPDKLPIVLLMLPVVLLFAALFMTWALILRRFWPRLKPVRRNLYAAYLSGLPCFLLLLGSVNQLTWRDVALVVFLVLCLWFYTGRANFAKSRE